MVRLLVVELTLFDSVVVHLNHHFAKERDILDGGGDKRGRRFREVLFREEFKAIITPFAEVDHRRGVEDVGRFP